MVLYRWEVRKRGDRKTQKSRNEEKVEGFSSASLFPTMKWEAVTQGETIEPGNRPPDAEENPGSLSLKGGRISKTTGTFQIHSHKTRLTSVGTLTFQQLNPDSLYPI